MFKCLKCLWHFGEIGLRVPWKKMCLSKIWLRSERYEDTASCHTLYGNKMFSRCAPSPCATPAPASFTPPVGQWVQGRAGRGGASGSKYGSREGGGQREDGLGLPELPSRVESSCRRPCPGRCFQRQSNLLASGTPSEQQESSPGGETPEGLRAGRPFSQIHS